MTEVSGEDTGNGRLARSAAIVRVMDKVYEQGRLVREWDDEKQVVTEYDAAGKATSRPYTADEVAGLEAAQNYVAEQETEASLHVQIRTQINELRGFIGAGNAAAGTDSLNAIINTGNPAINSSPAQYIKALARILRQITRAEIRVSRIVARSLSGPAQE